jgi:hypothetical protein
LQLGSRQPLQPWGLACGREWLLSRPLDCCLTVCLHNGCHLSLKNAINVSVKLLLICPD